MKFPLFDPVTAIVPIALGTASMLAVSIAPARAQVVADDVVCSKCVEDTDIAPDSIGTAKIKDKSIEAVDLAPNSVGGAKIKDKSIQDVDLAPNSVGGAKIKGGSITAAELAPDAVFGHIIPLHADPFHPVGNCGTLLHALAAITDNDADNRYLIHLGAGVYDCGTTTVVMKPFVDIAGSGQNATVLKSASGNVNGGVLRTASNAELRNLTVEHKGGTDAAVAIAAIFSINARITNVVARVAAPATLLQSTGVRITSGASVTLTNVELSASDTPGSSLGIDVQLDVTAVLDNVVSRGATGGTRSHGIFIANCPNSITARNSVFSAVGSAVDTTFCADSLTELSFVSSQLDGGRTGSTLPMFRCVGSYGGGFAPLDAACN